MALTAIEARDAFSNVALDKALEPADLSPPDRRLATEIVYGVLKHRRLLDEALGRWLKKPLARLDPYGRSALRAGAYQLLFLDRVPDHAAISETVKVAKRRGAWRGSLTNAVLRRVAEHAESLRREAHTEVSDAVGLGRRFGLPDELAAGLIERLGLEQAIAYGEAIQSPPPVTLRVRPSESIDMVLRTLSELGADVARGRVAPRAIRVRRGGGPRTWPPLTNGLAVVQDEGSQLVGHLSAPSPGSRALDLCAGRGGKTLHLADLIGPDGQIVAYDRLPAKLDVLERTAVRLGLVSIHVHRPNDGPVEPLGPFDLVLVDAPCTGTGNLRRHPELRWKWSSERLARLEATQRELLDQAAPLVKSGGTLVYAVCSDWPSEGPGQITDFLARHEAFERDALPEGVDWEPVVTRDGDLLVQPHLHDADGFYGVRLLKRS